VRVHPGDGAAAGSGIKPAMDPNLNNKQGHGALKSMVIAVEKVNIPLKGMPVCDDEKMVVDDVVSSVSTPMSSRTDLTTPSVSRGHSFKRNRPGSLSRKRRERCAGEPEDDDSVCVTDEEERGGDTDASLASESSCASSNKRKRGIPPTTGQYVGRDAGRCEVGTSFSKISFYHIPIAPQIVL